MQPQRHPLKFIFSIRDHRLKNVFPEFNDVRVECIRSLNGQTVFRSILEQIITAKFLALVRFLQLARSHAGQRRWRSSSGKVRIESYQRFAGLGPRGMRRKFGEIFGSKQIDGVVQVDNAKVNGSAGEKARIRKRSLVVEMVQVQGGRLLRFGKAQVAVHRFPEWKHE